MRDGVVDHGSPAVGASGCLRWDNVGVSYRDIGDRDSGSAGVGGVCSLLVKRFGHMTA